MADGRRLAVGCDAEIHLWDVDSGRLEGVLKGHERGVTTSPSAGAAVCWPARGGTAPPAVGRRGPAGVRPRAGGLHRDRNGPTRLSPRRPTAGLFQRRDRLRNLGRRRRAGVSPPGRRPYGDPQIAFSADGRLLASVAWGDTGGRLWDLATGREAAVLPTEGYSFAHLCRTPAAGSSPATAGLHRHSLPGTGTKCASARPTLGGDRPAAGAVADRDGRVIAGFSPTTAAVVLDTRRPNVPLVRTGRTRRRVRQPGRPRAAATLWAKDSVRVWDTADGRVLRDLPVSGQGYLFFSPDGRWLVDGRPDGVPRLGHADLAGAARPRQAARGHHGLGGLRPGRDHGPDPLAHPGVGRPGRADGRLLSQLEAPESDAVPRVALQRGRHSPGGRLRPGRDPRLGPAPYPGAQLAAKGLDGTPRRCRPPGPGAGAVAGDRGGRAGAEPAGGARWL